METVGLRNMILNQTPGIFMRTTITILFVSTALLSMPKGAIAAEPASAAAANPTEEQAEAITRGALTGQLLSRENGKPTAGATIRVVGEGIERQADDEGRFVLELEEGSYTLQIDHPAYGSRTIENVAVVAGVERQVNYSFSRDPSAQGTIEEVVAVAKYVPQDIQLSERDTDAVLDSISAGDISISGDSNAAAALQRVTGLTVIDGKYVYVRGLGERYSATLLNGSELPSPDPARRVVPLDLFPTDVLGGIGIQKTYTPDMPGDFSGGVVKLSTKGIPAGFSSSIEISTGINDQSFGETGLAYDGGDSDRFGFDDGTRELPVTAYELTQNGNIPLQVLTSSERGQLAESLPNNYAVYGKELPADYGFSFDIGNRFDFSAWTAGVNLAVMHDNQWRTRTELRRDIGLSSAGPFIRSESQLERTDNEISLGAVVGLSAEWGNNTLESSTLMTRQTSDSVIRETGRSNDDAREIEETTLEWVETQLLVQQFTGKHFIGGLEGAKLDWQYTLSSAERDVPDRREILFARTSENEPFRLAATTELGRKPVVRSWENLADDNNDFGASIAWPVTFLENVNGELKGGIALTDRERSYDVIGWQFDLPSPAPTDLAAILDQPVEEQLVPANIGAGRWELRNRSQASDRYTAEHDITAAWLMGDLWFGPDFRGGIGARFEDSTITVVTADRFNPALGQTATLDTSDVLPALNATWFLGDASQLRFGLSKTLNRPQVRELTPVLYVDPETRFITRGNPDLRQAEVINLDLRYEYYFTDTEQVSIAFFYKDFTDPIELSIIGGGGEGLGLRTYNNVSAATDYGVEIDYRETLDEFGGFWESMFVNANLSLIESQVELTAAEAQVLTSTDRELQGQSPWVVNLQLGYADIAGNVEAALSLNMAGERIVEVGQKGVPDAYEQPTPQLDFAVSTWFSDTWKLKFKARNLLDPEYEVEQGGLVQRSYQRGRTYGISLEYEF